MEIGSHSIVGLSLNRLNNEDSYTVIEKRSSQNTPLILAAVADGMGGLAKGEVASQNAITCIETANLNIDLDNAQQRQNYLNDLVSQANQAVIKTAKDGGTTISTVLAHRTRVKHSPCRRQ